MKLSKLFHVLGGISGVAGVLGILGLWGEGTMTGMSGMMGRGQDFLSLPVDPSALILIAVWLQLATIHHMMLESKKEII